MSNIKTHDLERVTNFGSLVALLRDKLDWPLDEEGDFEDITFDWDADELGLKDEEVAKVREIHQLRPLTTGQPWGIFFISFEEKLVSVTVLRRMLRALVVKKRAGSQSSDRQAWQQNDLIFVTNFGASGAREIAFAHFSDTGGAGGLPALRVLGWNALDTQLHNAYVAETLGSRLQWPEDPENHDKWRSEWRGAFELEHRQVVRTSQELAKALADLAANIRARANELLAAETEQGNMRKMLAAFRKNLIHDLNEDGFADMFAQTISYGLLASYISRPKGEATPDSLVEMIPSTNPFLRELFSTFLSLGGKDKRQAMDFDELGVRDVVELLENANLEAVLRDFGDRNPKEDPVIHFYELFLKEYDPEKRMQRGVFYTPRPVVNFIVRGVDEILRTEFDLPLGLADTTTWGELAARIDKIVVPDHIDPDEPFVQILDPATGTGTFLVEVIDLIHDRMIELWNSEGRGAADIAAAWNEYVPRNLLPRLTAYELMMAPYSIAHLKVGLKLRETGYRFDANERARVYLTNALEPARDLDMEFVFMAEALAHEAQAANSAKADTPFTVILGNPPYAGHSKNNNINEIVELVYDYKRDWPDLLKPGQGKWLQDDYVKFIRMAQFKIDQTGFGVLGYITNHSFLDNPTFKGMRTKLKESFGQIRILDLHGNVKKKEKAPDGTADGGVFQAVAQGVAITEAIKLPKFETASQLWRDDLFGSEAQKLDFLVDPSTRITGQLRCPIILPECFFYPVDTNLKQEWQEFEGLPRAMGENGDAAPGIVTTHDQYAISFTESEQIEKVEWLIATPNEESARGRFRLCTQSQWDYGVAKRTLSRINWRREIASVAYRPFDHRVTVYNNQVAVHLRDRVMGHMSGKGNIALSTVRQLATTPWEHVLACDAIQDDCYISNRTKERGYLFPLWLNPSAGERHRRPNLNYNWAQDIGNSLDLAYVDCIPRGEQRSLGPEFQRPKAEKVGLLDNQWDGRGDMVREFGPRDLFDYMYAILHSPGFRKRYVNFLKSDFPRIPKPKGRAIFAELVPLGRDLVALHLLRPDEAAVLETPIIRFAGSGDARVEKSYPKYENGKIMINSTRWFEDVPKATWEFQVGCYQVCQKWLKDRAGKGGKNPSPGRVLTDEDILHYRRIVVALTDTRRLMDEIDEAIEKHGGWPDAFYLPPPPPPSVEEIIEADESRELEFKSTFQWDMRQGKQNTSLRKQVLKSLAAFMNTKGGTLVIGVTDDKEIIGLEHDLKLVKNSLDAFENSLLSVFGSTIGAPYSLHCELRFADAPDGKKVCVIDVTEAKEPVFVEFEKQQEFFIRRGNATVSLNASEQHAYTRERF